MSKTYKIDYRYSIFNERGDYVLDVEMEFQRGILFIRLKGILDPSTRSKLQEAIHIAVHQVGVKYLMLNCEKLYSIDNESLDMIFRGCLELFEKKGKLLACGFNDYVRLKVEQSKLDSFVYKTENEMKAVQLVEI